MAKKTSSFDAYVDAKLGADPALNALYQRELARLKIANQIVAVREFTGLSQADLALRIGTKQPTVARMERASYTNYTLATLAKIAAATGGRLDVRIHPPRRKARAR
jgi:ribosome-binding protein aMBF1 (putative translation factor)